MKKILTITLLMFAATAFAQTNPITAINISLPANPDAVVAKWANGATFAIEAVSAPVNGHLNPALQEAKILVTIKKGGAVVCGDYSPTTAQAAGFNNVKMIWSGGSATSFLGKGCTLPPGEYMLSVQFFGNVNGKIVALTDDKLKPFTIRGNDQQSLKAAPQQQQLKKAVPLKKD